MAALLSTQFRLDIERTDNGDPVDPSVFGAETLRISGPPSLCDGCPQGSSSSGASPTSTRSSSPSTNPSLLALENRRGSYSCVKEDDCGRDHSMPFRHQHGIHHISCVLDPRLTHVVVVGTAQSFVVSRISSALHLADAANTAVLGTNTNALLDQPDMDGPTICCSCGGVQGWQYTHSVGKRRSKSYVDLKFLAGSLVGDGRQDLEWAKRPKLRPRTPTPVQEPEINPPGQSPLERLPTEVLGECAIRILLSRPTLTSTRPDHLSFSP